MTSQDKETYALLGFTALIIGANVAIIGGIIYVVLHFLAKIW